MQRLRRYSRKAMVGFGARREIGDGDDGGGGGGCVENAEFSVSSSEGTREVGPVFFYFSMGPTAVDRMTGYIVACNLTIATCCGTHPMDYFCLPWAL